MFSYVKKGWNAVKGFAQDLGAKALAVVVSTGAAVGSLVSAKPASAALDPSIATGLTQVQTDFTALLGLVYPIMISITAAIVIFGLAKMFIHKAAGK